MMREVKELNVVEELARIHKEEAEHQRQNPLAGYSTLQLKRELRRRKKQQVHF